jgi:hypothetical protein
MLRRLILLAVLTLPALLEAQTELTLDVRTTASPVKVQPDGMTTITTKVKPSRGYTGTLKVFPAYIEGADGNDITVGQPVVNAKYPKANCKFEPAAPGQFRVYSCIWEKTVFDTSEVVIDVPLTIPGPPQKIAASASAVEDLPPNDEDHQDREVTVGMECGEIKIAPDSLPRGKQGAVFADVALAITGGSFPYKVTVSGLPAGMQHASFMGANVIGGTPTQSGTFALNVNVEDSTPPPAGPCKGSKSYQLTIEATQVGAPRFVIEKKATMGTIAADGSFTVSYTLIVTNDGTAPGTAMVEDKLAGNVEISLATDCVVETPTSIFCTTPTTAPGGQRTFTFDALYKAPHPRTYTNTATVTTDQTGATAKSNVWTIKLSGIPSKFLQPATNPAPANTSGRKR